MSGLLRSELLKLRTTRTSLGLLLALCALVALVVVVQLATGSPFEEQESLADLLDVTSAAVLFALILGILPMSGEYRHGTATQTFLVTPRRERVVLAKLAASALAGFLVALAACALALAIGIAWLAAEGGSPSLGEDGGGEKLAGILAGSTLWAALGVGVAALVRNQVAAIVGTLLWLFVVEPLIGTLDDDVLDYLPNGAMAALLQIEGEEPVSRWAGAAIAAAYTVGFAVAGTVLVTRRDVA